MSSSFVAPPLRGVVATLLAVAALLLTAGLAVDLEPKVSSEFFFSPGDPALRAEQRITGRFGSLSQVLVLVSSRDVASPAHRDLVERLTAAIEDMEGVLAVHSLARGPDDLADARDSPLWRRLVLAGDGSTSFVIANLRDSAARPVVDALEALVEAQARPGFELSLAGVPYTVEVMRRNLVRDFSVFSAGAVVAFGAVILLIFRSGWILLGTLASCGGAVAATLILLHLLGFGIGLLTANLTTIVFVLTQSHVVFLATNWQALSVDGDARERVARARDRTLRASLSSAATTLLGFASLLFVPARPLQELGAGGCLGAAIALASAYLVLPVFLERARPKPAGTRTLPIRGSGSALGAALAAGACLALALGLPRLETDPSLLAYFDEESEVHEALATLDRAGGSSPLSLVVQRNDRARLDSGESYEKLWQLQHDFEKDPAVGRVVSLPLLVAEAERFPGAFLFTERWLLDRIGPETTGAFLTRDRRQTLFLLQMAESGRETGRLRVIERLRGIAADRGFDTPLAGGIYQLQARLAELVARSVVWSLGALVLLFTGVAVLAGGSLRVGVAAGLATALVPAAVLGGFGVLAVPLDVIAAPAASVGLGLAADAALHLIAAWRRLEGEAPDARWSASRREQGRGILRATGIVALGFGLFALSSFPPTRRFGLAVAAATAVGAIVALWVLPVLAQSLGAKREEAEDPR